MVQLEGLIICRVLLCWCLVPWFVCISSDFCNVIFHMFWCSSSCWTKGDVEVVMWSLARVRTSYDVPNLDVDRSGEKVVSFRTRSSKNILVRNVFEFINSFKHIIFYIYKRYFHIIWRIISQGLCLRKCCTWTKLW